MTTTIFFGNILSDLNYKKNAKNPPNPPKTPKLPKSITIPLYKKIQFMNIDYFNFKNMFF